MTIPSYSYLEVLNQNLDQAALMGKSVRMKLEGSGSDRHVVVVQGFFETCFAVIGKLLRVSQYNLEEISSVFQQQVGAIRADDQKSVETVCHLTDVFLEQIEDKVRKETVDKIEQMRKAILQQVEPREAPSKTLDPVEIVLGVNASAPTEQLEKKQVNFLRELEGLSSGPYKGVDGSLAQGTLRFFRTTLGKSLSVSSPISAAALFEGHVVLSACGRRPQRSVDKIQCQRALLLLELRSLLRKVEVGVLPALQNEHSETRAVQEQLSNLWRLLSVSDDKIFLESRLMTISDKELTEIFDQIVKALEPISPFWTKDIVVQGDVVALPFETLKNEWIEHKKQLEREQDALRHALPLDVLKKNKEYKESHSLRAHMLALLKKEYKEFKKGKISFEKMEPRFREVEYLIRANSHEKASLQEKHAEFLIELRTLLELAKGKKIDVEPLFKELAGPEGFQDDKRHIFTSKRLNEVSLSELQELQTKVLRTLRPLYTWSHYGPLSRECRRHYSELKAV